MKDIHAFILCGGKGTRLRPYTYTVPKPMLKIGQRPLLEFVIRNLKRAGITKMTLTVGYLKDQIMDYFGDGSSLGVKITYLEEDKPKNTAGSIIDGKGMIPKDKPFVVMMGDHLTNVSVKDMMDYHVRNNGIATLAIKLQGIPLEYGIVEIENALVKRFREKPVVNHNLNTAMYVCEYRTFDYIEEGYDFASDVFPLMLEKGEKLVPYMFEGYWEDIGRLHDYERVHQMISLLDFIKEF